MKKTQGLRARNFFQIFAGLLIGTALTAALTQCGVPADRQPEKAVYESQPPKTDVSQPLQDDGDWNLILVNEDHPLPESFSVDCSQVSGGTVDTRIAGALQNMIAAGEQDGVSIYVSSGYRSVERQRALFDRAVQQNLAKGMDWELADATAAKSIARPGRSEHNTGLAVDLNGVAEDFDTTAEYRWLQENAEDFGFILRFPADKESVTGIRFEPWHYCYVGVEHAKEMNRLGMCLEEYIDYLNAQK